MVKTLKVLTLSSLLVLFLIGCKEEEPECVPSGKVNVVTVEKTPLPKSELQRVQKDADNCRVCVLSPQGFYTCQVAWENKINKTREDIKKQARKLACTDAGFLSGKCPADAIKFEQCKGDPIPENTNETELTKSFKKLLMKAGGRIQASPPAKTTKTNDSSQNTTTPQSSDAKPILQ